MGALRCPAFRRVPGILAVLLVLTGCSSNPPATRPGGRGSLILAFTSNRPPSAVASSDIYFDEPSTGVPPWMPPNVNTPYDEFVPALSGNGEWMAFDTNSPTLGGAQLVLYHVPTGQLTAPSTPLSYFAPWNPSLSYDGRYLAFQVELGLLLQNDVVLMDAVADTLIPTPRLHAFGAADFDPALSGDGRLIAFATSRDGSWDIALYDVPGDSLLPLPGLDTPYAELAPSISSDGRFIVFSSNRPGGVGSYDIYLYDRRTSALVPLPGANTSLAEGQPAISPDGRYISFTTEAEGGGDLRLYDTFSDQLVPLPRVNDPYFGDGNPTLAQRP